MITSAIDEQNFRYRGVVTDLLVEFCQYDRWHPEPAGVLNKAMGTPPGAGYEQSRCLYRAGSSFINVPTRGQFAVPLDLLECLVEARYVSGDARRSQDAFSPNPSRRGHANLDVHPLALGDPQVVVQFDRLAVNDALNLLYHVYCLPSHSSSVRGHGVTYIAEPPAETCSQLVKSWRSFGYSQATPVSQRQV